MNTMFDFAPLWRTGIGFDHLFDVLGQAAKTAEAGYPPYDIERTGEDAYRVTLALAGWTPEEVTVVTEPNLLVIKGKKASQGNGGGFLYRGIPADTFERRFNLAEYVNVAGATLQNGLLTIELVREVPEAMKPRKIAIATNGNAMKAIEQDRKAA
jgi:molecular chaperone IbpA